MRLLSMIFILLGVSIAQAQIVIAPAFTYRDTQVEDNVTVESDALVVDVKAGYLHGSGLYLGANYSLEKSNDDDGFSVGPTVGYAHYSGFYALFTYYVLAEYETAAGNEYTEGMGPQVDLGWVFPLTSVMSLGPQISYKSISYDKQNDISDEITVSEIQPYISVWFHF